MFSNVYIWVQRFFLSNISIRNIDIAVSDLYVRTSNLLVDFSYAESTTLSLLYNSCYVNVYGS